MIGDELQRAYGVLYEKEVMNEYIKTHWLANKEAFQALAQYDGPVDGIFGQGTTAAVRSFQDAKGLHIDASSGFEAERAIRAGVAPDKILLTAQELPKDLAGLVDEESGTISVPPAPSVGLQSAPDDGGGDSTPFAGSLRQYRKLVLRALH